MEWTTDLESNNKIIKFASVCITFKLNYLIEMANVILFNLFQKLGLNHKIFKNRN